jgi:hypothetical protein
VLAANTSSTINSRSALRAVPHFSMRPNADPWLGKRPHRVINGHSALGYCNGTSSPPSPSERARLLRRIWSSSTKRAPCPAPDVVLQCSRAVKSDRKFFVGSPWHETSSFSASAFLFKVPVPYICRSGIWLSPRQRVGYVRDNSERGLHPVDHLLLMLSQLLLQHLLAFFPLLKLLDVPRQDVGDGGAPVRGDMIEQHSRRTDPLCLLYSRKQTSSASDLMSAKCQKRKSRRSGTHQVQALGEVAILPCQLRHQFQR